VTHLGDLVCVLIDDELGGDAYDHAVGHLDECAQCRRDVAGQRWVKAQLTQARPAAMPDAVLLARLLQIPESDDAGPGSQSSREFGLAGEPWLSGQSRLSGSIRSGSVRSRRLLGRTPPSRPLRTGQPAYRRTRTRTVAAAGFAASVVVGFSGAVSGSAAVSSGVGASATTPSAFSVAALGAPISAVIPRPSVRLAASVVYRRP
jgi:hypothetical protein